ncbi:MAG: FAD-dependent oxidoreductase, partial [Desulfobacterales bacterium]|nr:FAD-dependent oxidoreductase [Desulfobacterales bacterium]
MSSADNPMKMEKGFDLGQAIAEADRCLLCHDAPCSKGCPANTEPGAFIRKLRLKNITGAIRTIKENNILGGVCGVLCPTEELCEKECCAAGLDRPVQIGKIQRFLVEHAWERTFNVFEKKPLDKGKVAVVGAGPAGLSCAAQLVREGFAVTVFEAFPEPGGVLRYGVPAFRLEKSFLERELEEIRALGVEFKCNARIEGDKSAENLLDQGFAAVFLAPGAWGAARLQADRETLDGLYSSVEFLRAMRDGGVGELEKRVKGKTAAVIGGGSVAMDCATSAVRLGARDVYLLYRRSWSQMPAE